MVKKNFCDKCSTQFEPKQEHIGFIRFGHRELSDVELCDKCILTFEQYIRLYFIEGNERTVNNP